MSELTIVEILTIIGLLAGPTSAILIQNLIQKWDERRRDKNLKKINIFRMLMATRAARLSSEHVQALNSIDIDFSKKNKKDKLVITAWNALLDQFNKHLNEKDFLDENGLFDRAGYNNALQFLNDKHEEAFNELLFQMSRYLGYDFEKTDIKSRCYAPNDHANQESINRAIRDGLVKFLDDRPLDVNIVNPPE